MKNLILSLFLLACTNIALSQDVSGYWKGISTQQEGAYSSEYVFEFKLSQKNDSIIGTAYVYVDSIYAEMRVSGTIENGLHLNIKDDEIVEHEELQGMEWCIKTYQLTLKEQNGIWKMEGDWQGKTSFSNCTPGKIYLKKTFPRA